MKYQKIGESGENKRKKRKRREKEEKKKRKKRKRVRMVGRRAERRIERETEGCGNKQPKGQKRVDTEKEVWGEEGEGEGRPMG